MSRTLGAELQAHLAGTEGHTLARCLRLDLRDGTSVGITTLDIDLEVDLGDGLLVYRAATGVLPSAIKLGIGLESDSFEARGPLRDQITRAAVRGGRFNRARARLFDVNYEDTAQIARLIRGRVTARRTEGSQFVFEVRSLSDATNQVIGALITPYCKADYGHATKCGVKLDPAAWSAELGVVKRKPWDAKIGTVVKPTVWNGFFYEAEETGDTGLVEPVWPTVVGQTVADGSTSWKARAALKWPATVTAVTDRMTFTVAFPAGAPAADYFNGGDAEFLTGELAGTLPIEVFDYGAGVVHLLLPAAALPQIGDTLTLSKGCSKTRSACRDNRNTWNMHKAFPDVPGNDDFLRIGPAG